MKADRLQQIEHLYHAANELLPSERSRFLETACGGDSDLRREVGELLAQDDGEGRLEQSLGQVAAELLTAEPASRWKAGSEVGPYRILGLVGSGGMGDVFRARDTRLGRDVAIKTAHQAFGARFLREARAISALNHPNVCTLYDVGPDYLVMEYVEGRKLAGPLKLEKAVDYALQILDALAAAHAKGIIHRDLKPANIMVTRQGIKLLDFGLARQTANHEVPSVTLGTLTAAGQIAGTIQYMSPEQLQGRKADARSDIFSFGCLLYEMISGERAFAGSTPASVIAAVLEREPAPLKILPRLERTVLACLLKDPEQRFQTVVDLKRELVWAMEAATPAHKAQARLPWILAVLGSASALLCGALYVARPVPTSGVTNVEITTSPTLAPSSFAVSPDGRSIAYVASSAGRSVLWVRPLDSQAGTPLPDTEGALNPFWAPDGRSLGFFADQKLKSIEVGSNHSESLADADSTMAQGTWNEAGDILFTSGGRILRRTAAGGRAVKVLEFGNTVTNLRAPFFLPDGRTFLFLAMAGRPSIWLGSLAGSAPKRVAALESPADSAALYLDSGWLLRVRQNLLEALRLDPATGELSGNPVVLAHGVGVDAATSTGSFSVSRTGTLAWRQTAGSQRQLLWLDHSGHRIGTFGDPADDRQSFPELSPDGDRVAVARGSLGLRDIWLLEGIHRKRFTRHAADERYSIWSPDGAQMVFGSNRLGKFDLYRKSADGSGEEELILGSPEDKAPNSWSTDGRYILYASQQNNGDLMVLPTTGDRKPMTFLSTPFNERQGMFSPDGKLVAYQSNESGRFEIYLRPFQGSGATLQISAGGGSMPRWNPNGRELYYLSRDGNMMAVSLSGSPSRLVPSAPSPLFPVQIPASDNKQGYDVGKGGRFLINTELEIAHDPIRLLLNSQLRLK